MRSDWDGRAHVARHRRNGYVAAEHERVDGKRKIHVEIVAFALVGRVRLHVHHEIEVAARARTSAVSTLAGQADALSVAHALGNRNVEFLGLQQAPGTVALRAYLTVEQARTAAARAHVFDLQRDRFRAACVRLGERDIERRFEVPASFGG